MSEQLVTPSLDRVATRSVSRREFLRFSSFVVAGVTLTACMPAAAPSGAPAADSGGAPAAASTTGVLWGLEYDPHVETYQRLADMF